MRFHSRFLTVFYLSGFLVFIYSLSMALPVIIGLAYGERHLSGFLLTLLVSVITGGGCMLLCRNQDRQVKTREGFLIAVLFWLLFSAVSSMPFYLDPRLDISLADAVFEGVSGITTTGASVFSDVDHLPHSILFYRAQLNFFGGLGIIVLAMAVLPFLGIGGAKLYQSEMPGPLKEEKFTPRLADTAKQLWATYSALALLCAVAFYMAGMPLFDSVCHALSTVSLGGFSTHSDSLGYYHSLSIEAVGGIFSLLAAVNFALYIVAIARRSLKPVYRNKELQFFLLVFLLVLTVTAASLLKVGEHHWFAVLVHSFFQVASVISDNGLAASEWSGWPASLALFVLTSSFFGGCVGSTCGGIKAMRFFVLYRQSKIEMQQLIHPNAVYATRMGRYSVPDRVIRSVYGLFYIYLVFAVLYVFGLMGLGYDFASAYGTVAACLNNMGIGFGVTGSCFGGLSAAAKWLMCSAMLMGRLEIFPLLMMFSGVFWRY